ncbi:type IV secretion system protein TraC [Rosenbergiella collisarenosi]|uniref:type IV secretion system protein TraC n=1 Tax=Rosenbergiella collisarenosi TaxID=1544695 RepID=UPI003F6BFD30
MTKLKKIFNEISNLISAFKNESDYVEANRLKAQSAGYPAMSAILPYRYVDEERNIFINTNSIGYILELAPLSGANEQIIASLDEAFRKRMDRGVPVTFYMVASKCVSNVLKQRLDENMWKGDLAKGLNAITRAYYERAALKGFKTGDDTPLYLRNYRVFAVFGKKQKVSEKSLVNMNANRAMFISALKSAQINCRQVTVENFLSYIREVSNFRVGQVEPSSDNYDEHTELHRQIIETSRELEIHPDYIRITNTLREQDKILGVKGEDIDRGISSSRIVGLNINKNPKSFALWQGPDNLHNLLSPSFGISCPFVINFTIEVDEQVASQSEAFRKEQDLAKKANSAYQKLFPSTQKSYEEWRDIRESLNRNETSMCRYFFGLTLFTEDDDISQQNCEQQALNLYRKNGIQLEQAKRQQLRNYMTLYPFIIQEELWKDLKTTNVVLRTKSFNALNLAPIVTENSLSGSGTPLPSYRGQVSFLDIFDESSDATNFNVAVTGTSGAGKSFIIQNMLRQVLNSGGFGYVIDLGESYKNFCQQAGGVYLDGDKLRFNPWFDVVDIKESAESIAQLITVLASPKGVLDEVSEAIIIKAVVYAWEKGGKKAKIDYVVDYLTSEEIEKEYIDKPTILSRMAEISELLERYCTNGPDGEFFNSENPTLNGDIKFAVLELLSLESRPKLMSGVLYSIILAVQQKMYKSPRDVKKICVIDEAWRLLSGGNTAAAKFIETGYRTARRHRGCFVTITQGISDFTGLKDMAPSAEAAAVWNNSANKLTLLQDKKAFTDFLQYNPDYFNSIEKSVIQGFKKASQSGYSSVLIQSGGNSSFHRLFVDPVTRAMFSTKGTDYNFMAEKQKLGHNSEEAALMLAEENFGEELEELERWVGLK